MQIMKSLCLVALVFFTTCAFSISDASRISEDKTTEIEDIKHDLQKTNRDIEEVRRDQLNYRVEKDLLKEAYTTSLSTLNTGITIVLAVFSILGYFGIRQVSDIQKSYKTELEQLSALRSEFKTALATSKLEHQELSNQYQEITKTNETQDKRLRVLEIQEKARELSGRSAYSPALEYIAVGLSIDPKNETLLALKCFCSSRNGNFQDALETSELVISYTSGTRRASECMDACEYALMAGNLSKYDEYFPGISSADDEAPVRKYLELVRHYQNGDLGKFHQAAKDLYTELEKGQRGHFCAWSFDELQTFIVKKPNSLQKNLLLTLKQVNKPGSTLEPLKDAIDALSKPEPNPESSSSENKA